MDDRPELYELESIEQLRAIADPLRVRIINEIAHRMMTVTQVGETLGVPANKAHYHMRELERVGLVRIMETREKGGILEKYYQTVARDLSVSNTLLRRASPDESIAAASEVMQSITSNFLESFSHAVRTQTWSETINLDYNDVWLSAEEWREASRRIKDVLKTYPRGEGAIEGERRRLSVLFLTHPASTGQHSDSRPLPEPNRGEAEQGSDDLAAPKSKGLIIQADATLGSNKRHRVIAAGAFGYSRADLERVAEAGETLDLNVLGVLSFASDISAALAERTILRVRHRGLLHASPEVKAVLRRKGAKVQE